MSILSRYILRAHIAPAASGLAIFYFVLSMDFIVDYLNLFIAKGVPGAAVLEAFGLSLAWMTLLAVPMAVMVGVLTAFGRLSGDNEITAARSNGVSVFSLISPVLLASAVVAVGLFLFGGQILPSANLRLKALLLDIHRIRPLATVEPGILTELPGGYRIIVGSLDSRTSEIYDVRIHRIEGDDPIQTIVAKSGKIDSSSDRGTIRIQLYDGEIHELDPDDQTRYSRLLFERHTINVDQGTTELVRTGEAKRGDREMTLGQLREEVLRHRAEAHEAEQRIAELAARLGATAGAAETAGPAPRHAAGTRDAEAGEQMGSSDSGDDPAKAGSEAGATPVERTQGSSSGAAVSDSEGAAVSDSDATEEPAHRADERSGADPTQGRPDEGSLSKTDILRQIQSEERAAEASLRRARKLDVEYHKKFSISFSCIVFVLLGAPLGIRSRRGGVGMGAGIGILFFLAYYLFLIGGEQLGDRGLVSPFWAMWAPNVVFGGVGVFLTLSTSFEWQGRHVTRLIDFVLRPPRPAEQAKGAE